LENFNIMATTLVTSLTVHQPSEVVHRNDVPTRVEQTSAKYTDIEFTTRDLGVTVRLTGGERIALIEALGGKDRD
jgi:hypothetical protein